LAYRLEHRVKSPVLPIDLFKNQVFTLSNVIGFFMGAGMFGAIMYVPFYLQGVMGISAMHSGMLIMPLMLTMLVASAVGGYYITKTGQYRLQAIMGLSIMTLGLFMLSMMAESTSLLLVFINMMLIGLGLGISFPIFILTVQNAVSHQYLGVATTFIQLFRQLGGTVGVAIMDAVMNVIMFPRLQSLAELDGAQESLGEVYNNLQDAQILMDPEMLAETRQQLPVEVLAQFDQMVLILKGALGDALTASFLLGAFVMLVSVLLTLFLKKIPLRESNSEQKGIEKQQKA
jgi:hypothetical protein